MSKGLLVRRPNEEGWGYVCVCVGGVKWGRRWGLSPLGTLPPFRS